MTSASETRAKILAYVYQEGPVLPVKVSKNVGGSPLFIGAFLSELVSSGQIKLSKAKIGNSPLYYTKGQEEKLQILRDHLGQMHKKAFDLIKEYKVIRETEMEPAERVAISEIHDFAQPLIVEFGGNKERFWKWYLLSEDKAKEIIGSILKPKEDIKKPLEEEIEKPKEKIEEPPKPKEEEIPEPIEEENTEEVYEDEPEEIQETLEEEKELCDFGEEIREYIEEQGLRIEDITPIRKNKELNFIITMPSPVGKLRYLIKARSKKKVNEGDLSIAHAEGSRINLPIIYLSDGELTIKARKYLNENLRGLVFRSIN